MKACPPIPTSAEIDELLWRLGRALRAGRLTEWERGFALSLLGQAKRPRWNPSAKQVATLRRVIAELAEPADDLIDNVGGVIVRAAPLHWHCACCRRPASRAICHRANSPPCWRLFSAPVTAPWSG